eukprot:jgi/Botrbrau1/20321/Bobra.0006s0004.1
MMEFRILGRGVVLFVLATVTLSQAQQTAENRTLTPFTSVQVCTPFNILIQPSVSPNGYQLELEGTPAVRSAVRAQVVNGVLALESSGSFTTNNVIKVVVRLPSNRLNAVTVTSPVGITVAIAGGFNPPNFTLTNNGATALEALGVKTPAATISNLGTGTVVLRGTLGNVAVSNQGTGAVYVVGATQQVNVDVGGTGTVVLDNANGNVAITGEAQGLAYVSYNRGQCSVSSQFGTFFGGSCRQGPVQVPTFDLQWSCGLSVNGVFTCSGSSGVVNSPGSTTTINAGTGGTVTSVGGAPGSFQSVNIGPGTTYSSNGPNSAFAASSAGGTGVQTITSTGGSGFTVSSGGGGGVVISSNGAGTYYSSTGGTSQVTTGDCQGILLQDRLMFPTT